MNGFQPVPTLRQRLALEADHAKRYGVEQYRAVQAMSADEAIADFHLKRLRYEIGRLEQQPEPAPFCAPVGDAPQETPAGDVGFVALGLLAIGCLLACGLLLREPMARVLVALGVLS